MTTDKILVLEKTGKYQAYLFLVVSIPVFVASVMALPFSWTGYSPNLRCVIPGFDNLNGSVSKYNESGQLSSGLMHRLYPNQTESGQYCTYYTNWISNSTSTISKCDQGVIFDYEHSPIKDSLVEHFGMFCDNVNLKSWIWTLSTAGIVVSAPFFAYISDRLGRRVAALITLAFGVVLNFGYVLADNYYLYAIYTFLAQGFAYGTYLTSYIILMESCNDTARTWLGPIVQILGTMAELYIGLVAFVFPYWRTIQLLIALPSLLLLSFYWICPESIRWLLATGRVTRAKRSIKFACRLNNMSEEEIDYEHHTRDRSRSTRRSRAESLIKTDHVTILDMFKNARSAAVTLIVWFIWFACLMCYFGLAQNTADLSDDAFLAWTLSALVEIPGSLLAVLTMQYLGRRWATIISYSLAGFSCVVSGAIAWATGSTNTVTLILALFGRMWVLGAALIIYNYTMELFPTVIRQSLTTVGSMCGRIGAMAAPQIRYLIAARVNSQLAIIIYGGICVIGGLLCLLLPETKGKQPPETVHIALILYGARKPRHGAETAPQATADQAEQPPEFFSSSDDYSSNDIASSIDDTEEKKY